MQYISLRFPNNEIKELEIGKPVVILGANGSGKTRFSIKIEELNDPSYHHQYKPDDMLIHRLSAQKSLKIAESQTIISYDVAERLAYLGHSSSSSKFGRRYNAEPATHLLDDYNHALTLLFSKNNRLNEEYQELAFQNYSEGRQLPLPQKSLLRRVIDIWDYLLPKIRISLLENNVKAEAWTGQKYHGKEMSDGERVILYMIVQALSVKPNSILVIDEPELHIHKAILAKLWDKLESERNDCIFMYITHDIDFAVSRNVSEILWIKSYDGKQWDYEFLPVGDYNEIPEGLLFEVLGTQKKIIFVEGTKDSLDYLVYQEIYPDFHVIPCGGCTQVINYVRAQRGYTKLNHVKVYGIIDRDYRPQAELDSLAKDNISSIMVAEVENLFIVPELFEFLCDRLGLPKDTVDRAINQIRDIYLGKRAEQIQEASVKEINHLLNITKFSDMSDVKEISEKISRHFSQERIDAVVKEKEAIFLDSLDYVGILKVFNFKELSKSVDAIFGLSKGQYRQRIIDLIKKSEPATKQAIIDAIRKYLPVLPSE